MATVTYDGVASEEGGNIFKGTKFWVAHKVPMRNDLLDKIKNNGGLVVPLEKNSDMMIADHARKDAPREAYSWKFITESVQHGFIQVEDRYRIGVDSEIHRPAGSSRPSKRNRAPFTLNEDAALAAWVLSTPDAGRSGQTLFVAFATQYPSNHTWQSWRNRWVKNLCYLPRQELEQLAKSAPKLSQISIDEPKSTTAPKASKTAKPVEEEEAQPNSGGAEEKHIQPAVVSEVIDEATARLKGQFYSDLETYMEMASVKIEQHFSIADTDFEIWDLFKAMSTQKVPVEEVDWNQVAEQLGYNWVQNSRIVSAVQECCGDDFIDFIDAMADFRPDEAEDAEVVETQPEAVAVAVDEDGRVGENEEDQDQEEEEEEEEEMMGDEEQEDQDQDQDQAEEETEEEEEEAETDCESIQPIEHTVQSDNLSIRPSDSPQPHIPSSPPSRFLANKRPLSSDIEVPTLATKRRRLSHDDEIPTTPQPQPTTPTFQREQSYFDITPSQQLQEEWDDATPIPLRLNVSIEPTSRLDHGGERSGRKSDIREKSEIKKPVVKRTLPSSFSQSSSIAAPDRPRPRAVESRPHSNEEDISNTMLFYQSLGYSQEIVVKALMTTSMRTGGAAAQVMESLKQKRGIPTDIESVWTDRDDKSLRLVLSVDLDKTPLTSPEKRRAGNASRERKRLLNKHGQELMKLREVFLFSLDEVNSQPPL